MKTFSHSYLLVSLKWLGGFAVNFPILFIGNYPLQESRLDPHSCTALKTGPK
jgi:hypothetical protein